MITLPPLSLLLKKVNWKRFKKIAWIRSHHLQLQWKFRLLAGKFTWGNRANHCWVMSTKIMFSKVYWQRPAIFCLYTSSKLSRPSFEFSLKLKKMGSNQGYLLKSFLLNINKQNWATPLSLSSKKWQFLFSLYAMLSTKMWHIGFFLPTLPLAKRNHFKCTNHVVIAAVLNVVHTDYGHPIKT